jgi:antitoxin component YwqK of YwqJK toxin-antitoxin module
MSTNQSILILALIAWATAMASCTSKPPGLNQTDKEGRPHGNWVTWYPDSSIQSETQYQNGIKNGRETYYYPNGSVQVEKDYLNTGHAEVLHGREAHYYEDGTLLMEGFYKEGLPDSTWRHFYRDGTKELEAHYSGGKKTGTWKYYNRLEYMEKTISFDQYPTEWNNDLLNGVYTYYLSGIGPVFRAVWFQDQLLEEEILEPLGYELAKSNGIIDEPEYDFDLEMP